ncbi:MAG: HD-GYP domain-containing protein, partial [Vicinamibacteria bacterium]
MDWRERPASVRIYVSAVVGGGVAVYAWALYRTLRSANTLPPENLISFIGILLVAALSARWVVRIPRTATWMAVADCLIIAIVMIFGLAPGIVAHGLFNVISYWFAVEREPQEHRGVALGWSRLHALFNLSSGALHALAYGSVFEAVKPQEPVTAPEIVFPVLLVGLTYFLVNGSTHVVQALSGQAGFWELWAQDFPLLPIYFVASACGAAIVYLFYELVGAGAFALALPFWVVAYYAHRFYKEKYDDLAKVHRQTLEAFAFCIDAMELHTDFKHHTHTHIQRTQALTLGVARALNVDEKTYEGLRYASVLHDVGKISIPSYILHKPTRLTEREFQKMSTHPAIGAQILSSIDFPYPVVSIVKHHHENWDGSGYPDGLRGEEIP